MNTPDNVRTAMTWLNRARKIVALTGAGISTNAGIPDFRGARGLYVTRRYDPDTVFDIRSFHRDPKPFFDFARDFLSLADRTEPTLTHRVLADLEKEGRLRGIITQNIDGLHQKANSRAVVELHGSFLTGTCGSCGRTFPWPQIKDLIATRQVAECPCAGVIKPDIVFFGENVRDFDKALAWTQQADLFLVIGSSCAVYPAASLPQFASCPILAINQGPVALPGCAKAISIESDTDVFFHQLETILCLSRTGGHTQ